MHGNPVAGAHISSTHLRCPRWRVFRFRLGKFFEALSEAIAPHLLSLVLALSSVLMPLDAADLRPTGTVVTWGYNYSGGSNVLSGPSGVVAIAAGQFHGLALKEDGTMATLPWDSSRHGSIISCQCPEPSCLQRTERCQSMIKRSSSTGQEPIGELQCEPQVTVHECSTLSLTDTIPPFFDTIID